MKILVAEDEFTSRLIIQKMLAPFGEVHIAIDGQETFDAFQNAIKTETPYDLICLDIMMPEMDGQEVLKSIRHFEEEKGIVGPDAVKIIMTTSSSDKNNILSAFKSQCEAYLVKPINQDKLVEQLTNLGLV